MVQSVREREHTVVGDGGGWCRRTCGCKNRLLARTYVPQAGAYASNVAGYASPAMALNAPATVGLYDK